jgi:hypothetical protein
MYDQPRRPDDHDPAQLFVEEVLRTGLMLSGLACDLIEATPENAFPGEDAAEVLVEMMVGTFRPAAEAAGAPAVEEATALLGALADRTLADLKAAAELARESSDHAGGGT